jgi:hypothetical protein
MKELAQLNTVPVPITVANAKHPNQIGGTQLVQIASWKQSQVQVLPIDRWGQAHDVLEEVSFILVIMRVEKCVSWVITHFMSFILFFFFFFFFFFSLPPVCLIPTIALGYPLVYVCNATHLINPHPFLQIQHGMHIHVYIMVFFPMTLRFHFFLSSFALGTKDMCRRFTHEKSVNEGADGVWSSEEGKGVGIAQTLFLPQKIYGHVVGSSLKFNIG